MGIAGSTPEDGEAQALGHQNPNVNSPARVRERAMNAPQVASPGQTQYANNSEADDVPTVFKWEGGNSNCRSVYITGTFNNWERQLPMHRSGNDFTCILNLKRVCNVYLCTL
jgi:hypothetical protein